MKRLVAWCSVAALIVLSPAAFGDSPKITADQFTLKLVSGNAVGIGEYVPVLMPIPEADGAFHGSGDFWDLSNSYYGTNCLHGCQLSINGPYAIPDVMEINFSKPVSSAAILIDAGDIENSTEVQAFNKAGRLIATCFAVEGPGVLNVGGSPGCFAQELGNPPPNKILNVLEQFTITVPGIAHLLAGAENFEIDPVTFTVPKARGAPEPGTLALFALGVLGLGLVRRRRG